MSSSCFRLCNNAITDGGVALTIFFFWLKSPLQMTLYTGFPAQNKQQRPPPLFCILCNVCLLFRHELQLSDAVCLAYWPRAAGCPSFCLTHLI